ncbi:18667_t:CDS:2, partial [Acaulospora morrowiae]
DNISSINISFIRATSGSDDFNESTRNTSSIRSTYSFCSASLVALVALAVTVELVVVVVFVPPCRHFLSGAQHKLSGPQVSLLEQQPSPQGISEGRQGWMHLLSEVQVVPKGQQLNPEGHGNCPITQPIKLAFVDDS